MKQNDGQTILQGVMIRNAWQELRSSQDMLRNWSFEIFELYEFFFFLIFYLKYAGQQWERTE